VAPRDRGRRACGNDDGSSFPVREHRGCERAPEADSRRLSRADRWRVSNQSNPAKAGRGSTCRWKALWTSKTDRVDARSVERVLAPRKPFGFPDDAGRDRERQRGSLPTLHAVENAAARERRPERCSAPHQKWRRPVSEGTEARRRAVKRASTWGWASARWSGASITRIVQAKRRNEAGWGSASTKVTRSGIEQSAGARVVSRLQMSVRSIFSPSVEASREVNRDDGG
jgi:hypothetical protein